jgi:hypothetical protein
MLDALFQEAVLAENTYKAATLGSSLRRGLPFEIKSIQVYNLFPGTISGRHQPYLRHKVSRSGYKHLATINAVFGKSIWSSVSCSIFASTSAGVVDEDLE